MSTTTERKYTITTPNGCLTWVVAIALMGLIFLAAWNLGVVGIAAACGGHVSTINYWTALGFWLSVYLLGRFIGAIRKPR